MSAKAKAGVGESCSGVQERVAVRREHAAVGKARTGKSDSTTAYPAEMTRVQRHFAKALLDLMRRKPFGEITVSELAENALYDRRSFYRNFRSKDDILLLYCSMVFQEMADMMKNNGPLTPRSGFLAYFEFWDRHRPFLKLMDSQGLLGFLGEAQGKLLYGNVGLRVHDDLPARLDDTPEFSQFAYYFTLGGLWQVLLYWIQTGMKQSPQQLSDYTVSVFAEMKHFL